MNLTGYSLDQVLGRNCRFLQGPETDPKAVEKIRRSIEEGSDMSVCLLNYRVDGTTFWNQFFISALRDAAGNITNYVGVQCKVSDQYAANVCKKQEEEFGNGDAAVESAVNVQNVVNVNVNPNTTMVTNVTPTTNTTTMNVVADANVNANAGGNTMINAPVTTQVNAPGGVGGTVAPGATMTMGAPTTTTVVDNGGQTGMEGVTPTVPPPDNATTIATGTTTTTTPAPTPTADTTIAPGVNVAPSNDVNMNIKVETTQPDVGMAGTSGTSDGGNTTLGTAPVDGTGDTAMQQ